MLRFFRANDPYRLLGFFVVFVVMSLPFIIDPADMLSTELKHFVLGKTVQGGELMYAQIENKTPPLAAALFGLMSLIFGQSLLSWRIVALVLIAFQASYFSLFLVKTRAHKENTYLPSLLFGVLFLFSFDLISLSTELLGAGILLIVLKQLLDMFSSTVYRDDMLLKTGICIGLATFMVFSYWIFLLATILILLIFIRITTRGMGLLVFGFLLPHMALVTFYYYGGNQGLLWENFYLANLSLSVGKMIVPMQGILLLGVFPIVYFMISIMLINYTKQLNKHRSQVKKIMFIWLCFAIVHILFSLQITPSQAIPLIPPMAYFISTGLLSVKKKKLAELLLLCFLGGIITVSLLSRYDKISIVDYTNLFSKTTSYNEIMGSKKTMLINRPMMPRQL